MTEIPASKDKGEKPESRKKRGKAKERDALSLLHKRVRLFGSILNNSFKTLSIFGGAVVFAYCLYNRIYPRGLSLGEAPFLFLALMSFGFWTALGLMFGFIANIVPLALYYRLKIWLLPDAKYRFENDGRISSRKILAFLPAPEREKRVKGKLISIPFTIISPVFFILYIIAFVKLRYNYPSFWDFFVAGQFKIVVASYIVGLIGVWGTCVDRAEGGEPPKVSDDELSPVDRFMRKNKLVSNSLILVIGFLTMGSTEILANAAMSSLGIRDMGVAVSLDSESFKKLVVAAKAQDMTFCAKGDRDSDLRAISHVDIIWNRIGEDDYITVHGRSSSSPKINRSVNLTIPARGLNKIEGDGPKPNDDSCSWEP